MRRTKMRRDELAFLIVFFISSCILISLFSSIFISLFAPTTLKHMKAIDFVNKYCDEKQVKEACEILGDAYGK